MRCLFARLPFQMQGFLISLLLERLAISQTEMSYYGYQWEISHIVSPERYSWVLGPCQLDILETCDKDHIQFYLYTKKLEKPSLLQFNDSAPPQNFDPKAHTKMLIHGYAGSLHFNGTALIRQAYQELGIYNVIVVDWGRLVRLPCYPAAVLNTWQAGRCTAELIQHLIRLGAPHFNISNIHIIGFSLGAHVAAFASNHLQRVYDEKIGRITGLDPALPFFASLKNSWKLDQEDATFVDIIHTNSGIFGKIEATGHVDFYVNRGILQPACQHADNPPLCSHLIANVYFTESIMAGASQDAKQFIGMPCPSLLDLVLGKCRESVSRTTVMGEDCSNKTRGVYHVITSRMPPFAKG